MEIIIKITIPDAHIERECTEEGMTREEFISIVRSGVDMNAENLFPGATATFQIIE